MNQILHAAIAMFSVLPPWAVAVLAFCAVIVGGIVLQTIIYRVLTHAAKGWSAFLRSAFRRTRLVGRFALFVLALAITLPLVPMSNAAEDVGHRVLVAALILLIGWIVLLSINVAIDRYVGRLRLDVADNLLARKAVTQMRVLRRAIAILIVVITVAFALMTFDTVRQFGISLFASAGLAGIAAGLAARPLLSNLIAGVQLALTQPIRIDDVVVINNEWGWVEEFTSTYVVIRLWDWRRQIVPLSYFAENVFTNWTRSSSSIIGTVYLYLDYTAPVDRIREKAIALIKSSRLWDGQAANVQVSDAKQLTMEVRVLMSAADSSKSWDLRCEIREKLICYIQKEYPGALPRSRSEAPRSALIGETRAADEAAE